jgi:predicted nuclease of predicted toxin-antitoxin system
LRILADLNISPRTVEFLRSLGHHVLRVDETLPITASDIIALSGKNVPSLISLRLSSSSIEYVNAVLQKVLPALEQDVLEGMIITVEDQSIRRRKLPIE